MAFPSGSVISARTNASRVRGPQLGATPFLGEVSQRPLHIVHLPGHQPVADFASLIGMGQRVLDTQ